MLKFNGVVGSASVDNANDILLFESADGTFVVVCFKEFTVFPVVDLSVFI